MNKTSNLEDCKSFPIIWAMVNPKQKPKPDFIGVCGYEWKPFLAADALHAATMHDVLLNVSAGKCEEEKRCLNVSCVFNKTTPETFALSQNLSDKPKIGHLKREWKRVVGNLATWLPTATQCKKAYEADPQARVFEFDDLREIRKEPKSKKTEDRNGGK